MDRLSGLLCSPSSPDRAQAGARAAGAACCALGGLEVLAGLLGFPGTASGLVHVLLGWGLAGYTSRGAALGLFVETSVSFFVALTTGGFGVGALVNLAPCVLGMLLGVQGLRCAGAYHRYAGSRTLPGNVLKKGSVSATYAVCVLVVLYVAAEVLGLPSAPGRRGLAELLVLGPAYLTLAAGLAGKLPLTRGLPFAAPPSPGGDVARASSSA